MSGWRVTASERARPAGSITRRAKAPAEAPSARCSVTGAEGPPSASQSSTSPAKSDASWARVTSRTRLRGETTGRRASCARTRWRPGPSIRPAPPFRAARRCAADGVPRASAMPARPAARASSPAAVSVGRSAIRRVSTPSPTRYPSGSRTRSRPRRAANASTSAGMSTVASSASPSITMPGSLGQPPPSQATAAASSVRGPWSVSMR